MYRSVIIERYFSLNHPSLSAFSIFPVLCCLLQIQDFSGIFWSLCLFMLFLLDKMFVNCDCVSPPPPLLSCQLQKRKRREYLSLKSYENVFPNSFFVSLCCRDRVSRPTSVFDRNGYDPFARARRSSLSKKSKMKQMKQQVAPSIVKQTDYSQVHDR